REQVAAALADARHELELPVVQGTRYTDIEQIRVSHHRIDGGADLVAMFAGNWLLARLACSAWLRARVASSRAASFARSERIRAVFSMTMLKKQTISPSSSRPGLSENVYHAFGSPP